MIKLRCSGLTEENLCIGCSVGSCRLLVLTSVLVTLLPARLLQAALAEASGSGVCRELATLAALPAILATWSICSLSAVALLKAVLVGKMRPGRYRM